MLHAFGEDGAIGEDDVFERGGMLMLRREAIVGDDGGDFRGGRDLTGEALVAAGRTHGETAAVRPENNVVAAAPLGQKAEARDAAEIDLGQGRHFRHRIVFGIGVIGAALSGDIRRVDALHAP